MLQTAKDQLDTAVKFAIAGNVLDFAANPGFQLEEDVQEIMKQQLAIDDYHVLADKLGSAKKILYLADNAGETVFDRHLIDAIGKPVAYAVRENLIINDATEKDAIASGLDEVSEIVSSGCDAPRAPRLIGDLMSLRQIVSPFSVFSYSSMILGIASLITFRSNSINLLAISGSH